MADALRRGAGGVAVGGREFVEEVAGRIEGRVSLEVGRSGEETWAVREAEPVYCPNGGPDA